MDSSTQTEDENSQRVKDNKIPYQDFKLNLKSAKTGVPCLVRFHNCTNKNIRLYWLDFQGNPVKYPTVRSRQSMAMNTYLSHLWFFKAKSDRFEVGRGSPQLLKVLAIPEEALDPSCNATMNNYRAIREDEDKSERLLICPLCQYVVSRYSRRPIQNPCHHYRGETKLSSSDLGVGSYSNPVADFIYSCSEDTHHECHSTNRRNIYLVESFYNLRERCFIQMNDKLHWSLKNVDLDLPITLLRDYVQFADVLDKCKTVWG